MSKQAASLFLASGNPHKVAEIQRMADEANLAFEVKSARALGGMPEVVEDTGTFVGNAGKKARALAEIAPAGSWVMADDSGICVDALGGEPGVESAYFAGPENDDDANLAKLVEVMRGIPEPERGAHYVCVLFVLNPNREPFHFEGRCHGTLVDIPVGKGGFGYDPLFIPKGYPDTFGVLSADTKQALSHRAAAWRKFVEWIGSSAS
ncbi:MAG: XTP/dITP diphosphatase [Synoicihabitans sp.]